MKKYTVEKDVASFIKKEFEKKFKVKDVEIPGLEWMSKLAEERDYKAEYKKYGSSKKAKKYFVF